MFHPRADAPVAQRRSLAALLVALLAGTLLLAFSARADAQPVGCSWPISPRDVRMPGAGGVVRIFVNPEPFGGLCFWPVMSEQPWMTISNIHRPVPGDGFFDIVVAPQAPVGSTTRVGRVQVANTFVTVTQDPLVCSYTPTLRPSFVGAGATTVTVFVSIAPADVGCPPWRVTGGVPWISGSGTSAANGGVMLSVAANAERTQRAGTILVNDSASLTLTQAAPGPRPYVELGNTPGGDVLTFDPATGEWDIWSANDALGFERFSEGVWASTGDFFAADFNGDGLTDYLQYDRVTGAWRRGIAQGHPLGPFTSYVSLWAPGWTVTILDASGDGRSDVFLYNPVNGQWFLATTVGDADFAYTTGVWGAGWQVRAARFDADRRDDLFLYNANPASDPNSGRWFRVFSRAHGFEYLEGSVRWAPDWNVTLADLDGDQLSEVFLYNAVNGRWFLARFDGADAHYTTGVWAAGWSIYKADFDGNGIEDLFLYQASPGALAGLTFRVLSSPDRLFRYVPGDLRWAPGWQVDIVDFDADGRSDVLLYDPAGGHSVQVRTQGDASAYGYSLWTPGLRILASPVTPR